MPDDGSLDWYGSGDVNNDQNIGWDDLYRLDSMLSGIFPDGYNTKLIDRSDMNGDENISMDDRELLKDYLEGSRNCLPGHWNCLATKEERIDWLEKVIKIDRTDEGIGTYDYPGDYYADQLLVNLHGFEDEVLPIFPSPPIDFHYNGRFNLPITYAGVFYDRPNLKLNRNVLAIMIGDNVFNWNDWCYIDPQWDQVIVPTGFSEPTGDESFPPLNNYLDGINNITRRDTTDPSIRLNVPEDIVFHNSGYFNLDYTLSDINLRDAHFYIDEPLNEQLVYKDSLVLNLANDKLSPVFNTTGTLNLRLRNGQYQIGFEVKDHFFNTTSREFQLFVDDPPPKINILSPVEDSIYHAQIPSFQYVIEESDFSKAWYTVDSGQMFIEIQQEGFHFLDITDGNYQIIVSAEDVFGNMGMDTVRFTVDLTDPDVISRIDVNEDSVLFIYPNPVGDFLNILVRSNEVRIIFLDIQDSSGRVLWESSSVDESVPNNRILVDLSGHPQGVYFLKCYFDTGKRIMKRIIKL